MRLTIDQLAQRVGMTTRTIRAHQTRGLLPPPALDGRTGYYDAAHVARLELIQRLQDRGLNLAAIALAVEGHSDPEVAGIARAVVAPFGGPPPVEVPVDDLARRLGGLDAAAAALPTAERLGIATVAGDRVRLLVPGVVDAAEQLLAIGVPLEALLLAVEAVDAQARAVATTYVQLALEHLVSDVAARADDPEEVQAAVERLARIGTTVLDALYQRAMAAQLSEVLDAVVGEP